MTRYDTGRFAIEQGDGVRVVIEVSYLSLMGLPIERNAVADDIFHMQILGWVKGLESHHFRVSTLETAFVRGC